jgi:hypothetical protein
MAVELTTQPFNLSTVETAIEAVFTSIVVGKSPIEHMLSGSLVEAVHAQYDLRSDYRFALVMQNLTVDVPHMAVERREILAEGIVLLAFMRDMGIARRLNCISRDQSNPPRYKVSEMDMGDNDQFMYVALLDSFMGLKGDNPIFTLKLGMVVLGLLTSARKNRLERGGAGRAIDVSTYIDTKTFEISTFRIIDFTERAFSLFFLKVVTAVKESKQYEAFQELFKHVSLEQVANIFNLYIYEVDRLPVAMIPAIFTNEAKNPTPGGEQKGAAVLGIGSGGR